MDRVIIISATTLCGRLGKGFKGSPVDRRFLEEMRDNTDASLIGAGTLRENQVRFCGTDGKPAKDRIRAIISWSGEFPVEEREIFFHGPAPIVFTSARRSIELQSSLQGKATVKDLPEVDPGVLDLSAAIEHISNLGAKTLLIEGGASLNYHALAQRVATEIMVTICPFIHGEKGVQSLAEGPTALGNPALNLTLLNSRTSIESGEVFLHYSINYSGDHQCRNRT